MYKNVYIKLLKNFTLDIFYKENYDTQNVGKLIDNLKTFFFFSLDS